MGESVMGVGYPNCNCPQCVAYREERYIPAKERNIPCEHLEERFNQEGGPGHDPDWFYFNITPLKRIVLCGMCREALYYDMSLRLNREMGQAFSNMFKGIRFD